MKRILSAVLALILCGSMMGTTALATGADARFDETYWLLNLSGSLSGQRFSLFHADGTYSYVTGSRMFGTGTWSWSGGTLLVDGEAYLEDGDGFASEAWYESASSGRRQATLTPDAQKVYAEMFNEIPVYVDGKCVEWTDVKPFIRDNRTLVPLRAVADAMGLRVEWDPQTRIALFSGEAETAIGTRYLVTVAFPIGSATAHVEYRDVDTGAYAGQRDVQMDTSAVLVDNRTYAPIRYLAEQYGCEVGWNSSSRRVDIRSGGYIEAPTESMETTLQDGTYTVRIYRDRIEETADGVAAYAEVLVPVGTIYDHVQYEVSETVTILFTEQSLIIDDYTSSSSGRGERNERLADIREFFERNPGMLSETVYITIEAGVVTNATIYYHP